MTRSLRSIASLVALLCLLPVLSLWLNAMGGASEWQFLLPFMARAALGSLLLTSLACLLSLLLALLPAWLVSRYRFYGRCLLDIALMLPLAMPAYVLAMLYAHWLDAAGIITHWLQGQGLLAVGESLPIRSPIGAALVLALALYPYVYMLARIAFTRQCHRQLEAAQLLGASDAQLFWRVALPAARPAIVAGLALVMMESLADFGVASLYGLSTLTTAIYRSWFSLSDAATAARLAMLLLLFVAFALWAERQSRRQQPTAAIGEALPASAQPVTGWLAYASLALAWLVAIVALGLPLAQLALWAYQLPATVWHHASDWQALGLSLRLALVTALLCLILALLFAYAQRGAVSIRHRGLWQAAQLGYAVPGTVMAVAIFTPLLWLDRVLADALEALSGTRPGLLLTGTLAAMVIACSLRFLAVAMQALGAGLALIPTPMDESATLLGASPARLIVRLHLPLMWRPMLLAMLMVAADTIKELPATLILRPFDTETLAIRLYALAGDGQIVAAAPATLMLVALGFCLILMVRLCSMNMPTQENTV